MRPPQLCPEGCDGVVIAVRVGTLETRVREYAVKDPIPAKIKIIGERAVEYEGGPQDLLKQQRSSGTNKGCRSIVHLL